MLTYITFCFGIAVLIQCSFGGYLHGETYPDIVSPVDYDFATYASPLVAYAAGHAVAGYRSAYGDSPVTAAFADPVVQAYAPATSYQSFNSQPLIRHVPIVGYRASVGRYRPVLRSYGASLRSLSAPLRSYGFYPSVRTVRPIIAGYRSVGSGASLSLRIH